MSGMVSAITERWIRAGNKHIPLSACPLVMGVLNVTPDSFSDGGRYLDPQCAQDYACEMVEAGADIIDVGAESTRPGSQGIDEEEELRRLRPILTVLGQRCAVPLSVDTRKAVVAKMAIDCGVHVINDISALRFNAEMGAVIAKAGVGVVLMHMQGDPQTMQEHCQYDNVVEDVKRFLQARLQVAESYGIGREQILIDPGIGFAKTLEHNLTLLKALATFRSLGQPVLVGVSRKSFIGSVLNRPVSERLMGTAAAVATAVLKGAQIVRVHDVAPMRDVVNMVMAIQHAS